VEESCHLAKFARKVTIVHRRDELRATKSIREKAFETDNIDFRLDTVVQRINGTDLVESIVFENLKTGEVEEVHANEGDGTFGVFIFVGTNPQTKLFEGVIDMDKGYIVTDEDMHTNIHGVFAAGDVRVKSLRQVVTAAADGAIAAVQIERLLL
jgi:thioredoxin reductase (NADPH)